MSGAAAITDIVEYKRRVRQRSRLTAKKRKLAENIAAGMERGAAAIDAGYVNKETAYKYLAKTPSGEWCDPVFGEYLERCQGAPPEILETKDPQVIVAYHDITRELIIQDLYSMFTDRDAPAGSRAKIGEILLKEIRYQEERSDFRELPPEEAAQRAKILLGIK